MLRSFALCAVAAGAAATLAISPARAAGTVDVSFKPVDQLADVGRGTFDGERHVQLLAEHFKSLAAKLPDGQSLKVEVLDVDMAGEMRPTRRGSDIRVIKGGADWPQIKLRWSLESGGKPVKGREETISDMAYLMNPLRGTDASTIGYEKRMIDRWFREQVLAAH